MPSAATVNPAAPRNTRGYTAIVLAGKRPGIDPVAAAHGQTYKALVEIDGIPMLTRVVRALSQSAQINDIVIVHAEDLGPLENISGLSDAFSDKTYSSSAAQSTISDSVLTAMESQPSAHRFLVTTSDHALLTAEMVDDFLNEAETHSGINIAFVDKAVIEAAHPGMRRTYLRFKGAEISGANLFAINGSEGRNAVSFFQRIEQNRKRPWKMISQFGVLNLIGFALHLFTPVTAFRRVSKRLNCSVRPVMLSHANAAVDVDKLSDLETVKSIIEDAKYTARRDEKS